MAFKNLKTSVFLLLFCIVTTEATAVADVDPVQSIARLNLEELLRMDVTSVLRKEQTQSSAPAALYVLTSEEIRRSGATSIPEALRLVPGITVTRTNSNTWIVASRGFDVKGATKLLVLMDGRSVYSPFFSGVFWDIQDTFLDDIDRIEVIRGPGAVTWGENAMNGVINIITKSAADTQGLSAVGSMGKEEKAWESLRYGGKLDEDTAYRVYGKYIDRGQSQLPNGDGAQDGWDSVRGGFRADSKTKSGGTATLQGDIYNEDASNLQPQLIGYTPPFMQIVKNQTKSHGGNILGRYTTDFSDTSQLSVQAYYDRTSRRDLASGESRDTFDFDAQHHVKFGESNDLVYGLDYRFSADSLSETIEAKWDPPRRTTSLVTTFIQDQIEIVPKRFSIIPGTKLGYNDMSGFEYQPAIKAAWTPNEDNTVWASVSRAVRIPSRFDQDLTFYTGAAAGPDGTPIVPTIIGSKSFEAEKVMAYELGYRSQPLPEFSYDVATFYNHYDDLLSAEPGTPFFENDPPPSHLIAPLYLENKVHGDTYGVELATTWRPAEFATFAATYSYIDVNFVRDSDSNDILGTQSEGKTPHNEATARAHLNLPRNVEVDLLSYYVDSLQTPPTKGYLRFDARIGWRYSERVTFDIVGQNLFDATHSEGGTEIERAYYARVKIVTK